MKEQRWQPSRRLTWKQNNFVRELIRNPKQTPTDAAMKSHDPSTRNAATVIGTTLMKNPRIRMELAKYSGEAEETVHRLMKTGEEFAEEGGNAGAAYAGVSLNAAKDILDRVHGKATQRTENLNVAVELNVNLS